MQFKATLTVTYEVNPEDYGSANVQEMLEMDKLWINNDPAGVLELGNPTVEVSLC